MGSVFKKAVTRPSPSNAEIIVRHGVRLARWRDARGKVTTAPPKVGIDGAEMRFHAEARRHATDPRVNVEPMEPRLKTEIAIISSFGFD